MDKIQLLNDFTEGVISPLEEQRLFAELATNQELRTELKGLLSLNSTLNNNRVNISPNPKTKAAVFQTLGLQMPNQSPNVVGMKPNNNFGSKIGNWSNLFSAVAGGLIVYLLLNFGWFNENGLNNSGEVNFASEKVENSKNDVNNAETKSEKDGGNINSNVPLVSSESIQPKPIVITKYVYVPIEAQNNSLNSDMEQISIAVDETVDEMISDNSDAQLVYIDDSVYDNVISLFNGFDSFLISSPESNKLSESIGNLGRVNQNVNSNSSGEVIFEKKFYEPTTFDDVFVEWRGHETINGFNNLAMSNKAVVFPNQALSIFVKLNASFAVGLDVRQENFLLNFDGVNAFGVMNSYTQQPNLTSLGAILRYYAPELGLNIRPFGQVYAGGTNVGFIGRAMAGVEYAPRSNLAFILGFEYGNLWYQHQNVNFVSEKTGLNYGIKYKF